MEQVANEKKQDMNEKKQVTNENKQATNKNHTTGKDAKTKTASQTKMKKKKNFLKTTLL